MSRISALRPSSQGLSPLANQKVIQVPLADRNCVFQEPVRLFILDGVTE